MTNMSDFKELIPEFYDVTRNDFLINKKKINFGQRWDGSIVNDVKVGVRLSKNLLNLMNYFLSATTMGKPIRRKIHSHFTRCP